MEGWISKQIKKRVFFCVTGVVMGNVENDQKERENVQTVVFLPLMLLSLMFVSVSIVGQSVTVLSITRRVLQ